jgi:hypothetical protein
MFVRICDGLFIVSPCFSGCGSSWAGGLNGHNALPRKKPASANQMVLLLGAMTNSVNLFGSEVICVLSVRPEVLPVFHTETVCLITVSCPV